MIVEFVQPIVEWLQKTAHRAGVAEEKIGNMGAKAASVVDKVVAAPGNLLHSAISTATGTVDKASKATSDVAQGVANRLDPDSDKKYTRDMSVQNIGFEIQLAAYAYHLFT